MNNKLLQNILKHEKSNLNNYTYDCDYLNSKLGVILYENILGSQTDIILSETSQNFNRIDIYYRYSLNDTYYVKTIYDPNGRKSVLDAYYVQSGSGVSQAINFKKILINGTTISRDAYNTWWTDNGSNQSDDIYITKVIGYK